MTWVSMVVGQVDLPSVKCYWGPYRTIESHQVILPYDESVCYDQLVIQVRVRNDCNLMVLTVCRHHYVMLNHAFIRLLNYLTPLLVVSHPIHPSRAT